MKSDTISKTIWEVIYNPNNNSPPFKMYINADKITSKLLIDARYDAIIKRNINTEYLGLRSQYSIEFLNKGQAQLTLHVHINLALPSGYFHFKKYGSTEYET